MNNEHEHNDIPAEEKALQLLKASGFKTIQQLDWVAKNSEGEWFIFEIKWKELYEPGPSFSYYGTGLERKQVWLRMQLLKDKGEKTYLLTYVKGSDEVYGAYLDELEAKGEFYDTPKDIRIYPIKNFSKGVEAIVGDLNEH